MLRRGRPAVRTPHAPPHRAAPAHSSCDARPVHDTCSLLSPAPLVVRHADVDSLPPLRLALKIAPSTQTSAARHDCAPIRLLRPRLRPVSSMSFAPAAFASLMASNSASTSLLQPYVHAFQMYVSRVLSVCFLCFIWMLQKNLVLHMLQWLHTHVSSVCSTCFNCFRRTLQMCVLNVSGSCFMCFIWMLQ
jgi:hypothetical protein